MIKTTFTIKDEKQYLSDIMREIPSNCILNKKVPGCGATTLELESKRNSIIIVPNVPVIQSKCKKYPNLLGVYEKVNVSMICDYMRKTDSNQKIMTTPESFSKIKSACKELAINIYTEFFCLMDECHQLIEDVEYRENIVLPINDFFMFEKKAMVSATPLSFNDPRFRIQNFKNVIVEAQYDYRKDIKVIHTYNILSTVKNYIEEHDRNTCIFLNSIDITYSLIQSLGIEEESTIYCAPKSRMKLRTEWQFDSSYTEWTENTMKRYNFFTGRFFNAFDLELTDKPDVLIVTDLHRADYTMVGVDTDCIQIYGRFRNGFNSLTHIYDTNPEIVEKSEDEIIEDLKAYEFAYRTIKTLYENADNENNRRAFGEVLETHPFRRMLYPDGSVNWFAIDNMIHKELLKGRYRRSYLVEDWYEECDLFIPKCETATCNKSDQKLKLIRAARSRKDKRRQIVNLLIELEKSETEFCFDTLYEIREIDPFIVEAYEVLGKERIEELKYSEKKIKEAIILNKKKGNKTIRLIKNSFKVGNRYSNERIVGEINRIFNLLDIRPEKEVQPKIIGDYFQVTSYKSGKQRGYQILAEVV